ncbi:AbrB/MazE/SpoVT family DNA-binding domain-containing protein, partial [Flavonifractor sp. An4]|uniref:AbrB/MazE/SpoVT family DNA-binding domain-containing protein n=1 Tax=Flavonifractor sp. An4 TaxID=1965634 RepID=UPI001FA8F8BD
MKATGIVRRIDDLGRIVIPKEIRRTMRIREGDPLEIDQGQEQLFHGRTSLFFDDAADFLYLFLSQRLPAGE